MRTTALTLLVLFACSGLACGDVTEGLIAYYPFDGSYRDMVTGGAGAPVGNARFSSGRLGQSIELDGQSSYVQIPRLDLEHQGLTLAAWVRFDSVGRQTVFSNGEATASYDDGIRHFGVDENGSAMFAIGIADKSCNGVTPRRLSRGSWHHIAYVADRSSGTCALFLDGVRDSAWPSKSLWGHLNTSAAHAIGAFPGSNKPAKRAYFDGCIDDFRIYGRALARAEIAELASAGGAVSISAQAVGSRYENERVIVVGSDDPGAGWDEIAADAAAGLMAGVVGEGLGRLLAEFTTRSLGAALSGFIGLVAEARLVSPAPRVEVGAFCEGRFHPESLELELRRCGMDTLGTDHIFPAIVFDNGAELGGALTLSFERRTGLRWRSVKSVGRQWDTPGLISTIDVLSGAEVPSIGIRPMLVVFKDPITVPSAGIYRLIARYGSGSGSMPVTAACPAPAGTH